MNRILAIICFLFAIGFIAVDFNYSSVAALLAVILSVIGLLIIRRFFAEDADFLTQIFLGALLVRLLFGIIIHVFELREFFAGDAFTYDAMGQRIVEIWFGQANINDTWSQRAMSMSSGWGMNYIVAAIYLFTGQNILAAQSFCAVIGAATAPLIYICAFQIFGNRRVGKISALLVAFYPAFVIWSGQLLKDGVIIFLLVLAMTTVLQLQRKFSYAGVALLCFSLFGILSLRFYIFYMVSAAVVGAFMLGLSNSAKSIMRRTIALAVVGLALTYLGGIENASTEFGRYGSLERLQTIRQDGAESADSGFAAEVDISTVEGLFTALPIGVIYLMLAPFPWQISNFRQLITLPEILLWWGSIPLLVTGLWFTFKHRLRNALPVLIFSLMLTLVYAITQGNVGTAYRQRTQIQVFLFIFIAVGATLIWERRENKRMLQQARQRQLKVGL